MKVRTTRPILLYTYHVYIFILSIIMHVAYDFYFLATLARLRHIKLFNIRYTSSVYDVYKLCLVILIFYHCYCRDQACLLLSPLLLAHIVALLLRKNQAFLCSMKILLFVRKITISHAQFKRGTAITVSIGKPPGNACLTQQIVRDFYGSKPVREYIVMQFKFYLNFLISSYYYYSVGLILIFCAHLLSILSRRHIGYMFLITKRIINLIEIRIFCYNQANDRIAMMCACMHV